MRTSPIPRGNETDQELGHQFDVLWDASPRDVAELHTIREKLCEAVDDAIKAYDQTIAFQLHLIQGRQRQMRFLIEETVADFRTWKRVVRIINHPAVLKSLDDKSPLTISNRAVRLVRSSTFQGCWSRETGIARRE